MPTIFFRCTKSSKLIAHDRTHTSMTMHKGNSPRGGNKRGASTKHLGGYVGGSCSVTFILTTNLCAEWQQAGTWFCNYICHPKKDTEINRFDGAKRELGDFMGQITRICRLLSSILSKSDFVCSPARKRE